MHSSCCLVRSMDFLPDDDTKTEALAAICSQSLLYTQRFEEHAMRMS